MQLPDIRCPDIFLYPKSAVATDFVVATLKSVKIHSSRLLLTNRSIRVE